ncbi:hypothetical protein U1Q18_010630, partial [Sarracenia purpurea var. burkii]
YAGLGSSVCDVLDQLLLHDSLIGFVTTRFRYCLVPDQSLLLGTCLEESLLLNADKP